MPSMMNALHTLPAPVRLPAGAGWYAKARASLTMYKTGVVNTWRNRKVAQRILARYQATSPKMLCRSVIENAHLKKIQEEHGNNEAVAFGAGVPTLGLSRSDLLTVLRNQRDWPKLPAFAVLLVLFFEMTPLVLWAFPRLSPSTCYSHGQLTKLRRVYVNQYDRMHHIVNNTSTPIDGSLSPFRLPTKVLRELAGTVCGGPPAIYRYVPLSWVRRRVLTHVMEVRSDDYFLRSGNLDELVPEEVARACMARGLPLNSGITGLRKWIDTFIEPMDAGFFVTGP